MKTNKMILMILFCAFFLAACGAREDVEVASSNLDLLPTAEPLPSATATVTVVAVGGGSVIETATVAPTAEPTMPPATVAPTATTEPEVEASSVTCILGKWHVANFETYLLESMMQEVPDGTTIDFQVGETSGHLALTFTEDEMAMTSEDFVIRMTVAGQAVETAVTAQGVANYVADETTITGTATDYDSTGVETNSGHSVTINIADFAAAGADGPSRVNYTCEGDTMVWSGPFATPIEMTRVD